MSDTALATDRDATAGSAGDGSGPEQSDSGSPDPGSRGVFAPRTWWRATRDATWWRELHTDATRRGLLLTALGAMLIAGVVTALPVGPDGRGPIGLNAVSALSGRSDGTLTRATPGSCLNWSDDVSGTASNVDCSARHRFEVTRVLDLTAFPGSEYGPTAPPPSKDRVKQISQEQCQAAARQYLGPKFDPNGRFTAGLVWSGDTVWRQSGERRMLCGLQLPGPGEQQLAFTGKVADVDQSKVWPAGTCLGIDSATNQPTDVPVDCTQPHAMEVTGTANLGSRFPGPLPADADQDQFVKDACTRATDAYLAPIALRKTTLTLIYTTVALPSWNAGSRQVACSIGTTQGDGGWATLVGGAKGELRINGQPPASVPDIPEERLNLPPIPVQSVDTSDQSGQIDLSQSSGSSSGSSSSGSSSSGGGQQGTRSTAVATTPAPAGSASTSASPSPAPGQIPPGNVFLDGTPPGPGQAPPQEGPLPGDVPPPAGDVPPPAAGADPGAAAVAPIAPAGPVPAGPAPGPAPAGPAPGPDAGAPLPAP